MSKTIETQPAQDATKPEAQNSDLKRLSIVIGTIFGLVLIIGGIYACTSEDPNAVDKEQSKKNRRNWGVVSLCSGLLTLNGVWLLYKLW